MRYGIDVVAAVQAELGEGPVWLPDEGVLQWVDIVTGRILRSRLDGPYDWRSWPVAELVTTALPAAGGRTLVSTRDELLLLGPDLAAPGEVLAKLPLPANVRFNDGALAPDGSLLIGTMSTDGTRGAGALYHVRGDGVPRVLLDGVTVSNGIGWTRDPEEFYYVDSATRRLELIRWDLNPASAPRRRIIVEFEAPAVPDGLAVDDEGCAWVACWDAGALRRYTPQGRLADEIALPVSRPTSCAFGGPDGSTLFVTTARRGLTPDQLAEQPMAGDVLAVDVGRHARSPHRAVFRPRSDYIRSTGG